MPAGPVTVASMVPAASGGTIAVISVSETTVNAWADTPPKDTSLALVKPVPVSVTTVPPACGGAVAVICVAEVTLKLAATVPKDTPVAPVKLVPVMVTNVPPAVLPVFGLTAVTVGAEAFVYVNWLAVTAADVPLGVV